MHKRSIGFPLFTSSWIEMEFLPIHSERLFYPPSQPEKRG